MASHLLYTQVLIDTDEDDRRLGMGAGWSWFKCVDLQVVYMDLGISPGMAEGIRAAREFGVRTEYRSLPNWYEPKDANE